MIIKGIIQEVIFRNSDNNYSVVLVDCNSEVVTAVGKFPMVTEGESVELTGNFVAHSKYGEQFSVTEVKLKPPTSKESIIKYLSSGLIKGVGVITATNIVNKFGESTLDIIEFNPSRLAEVRGVSSAKAMDIANEVMEVRRMQNAVMLMQHYGISTNLAVKIFNHYGNETDGVLKHNPYKLVEDVDGIGFFTGDRIAQSVGIPEHSAFRFRAGILHALKEYCDKGGNTYITLANLENNLGELLRLNVADYMDTFNGVLLNMVNDGLLKKLEKNGDEIYALTKFYNLEKIVAATLRLYASNNVLTNLNVQSEISAFETKNNFSMHENQKKAVELAINSGVSVITGGPGTGKTTIIKCILQVFKGMGKKVKLMAPTGRAAKRLNESCDEDASTIHRTLEVDFNNPNMFTYNNLNKLPYNVIIVDEVSMVDIQLFYYLIRALKRGTQIILVGDKDQLPSVGAGNVLSDILQSEVVPFVNLTHIYRQNEGLIITNAHLINEGKTPILDNKNSDFFFDAKDDTTDIMHTIVNMCTTRIPNYLNVDSSKIQVLAPMKNGICGIDNLNKQLQEVLNPPSLNKAEIVKENATYRVGDRVMQITNNYERVWNKGGVEGTGIFNGDIGNIYDINDNTGELTVLFEDGRYVKYVKADLSEITLSYAITIHKSQGSEFDVVIMPMIGGPPMLLTRNLLYTGVTRAKKMVVLVGSEACVKRMVKNNYTQQRFTLLKDFLTQDESLF